jgi:hypothetical protein
VKSLLVILALGLGVNAQAAKFYCQGFQEASGLGVQGSLVLECSPNGGKGSQSDFCVVSDGSVSSEDLSPNNLDLGNCYGERRKEGNQKMFVKRAYFDVASDRCWANYIRVEKTLFTKGLGKIDLTRTSGGDTHDNSGYQYATLNCQVIND